MPPSMFYGRLWGPPCTQVVVIAHLLLLTALTLANPIRRISMYTNLAGFIGTLGKSCLSFQPYWQNRASEVIGLREDLVTSLPHLQLHLEKGSGIQQVALTCLSKKTSPSAPGSCGQGYHPRHALIQGRGRCPPPHNR